jgi:hypothetical protein
MSSAVLKVNSALWVRGDSESSGGISSFRHSREESHGGDMATSDGRSCTCTCIYSCHVFDRLQCIALNCRNGNMND